MEITRRQFLEFMGLAAASSALSGCGLSPKELTPPIPSLKATAQDDLVLAKGFSYKKLISWGDPIGRGKSFGFNNDYLAAFPIKPGVQDHLILWVNHESIDPLFIHQMPVTRKRTLKQIHKEMQNVGGSLLEVRRSNEEWRVVANSSLNRRLDAFTPIPFSNGEKIRNKKVALGTFANCAGGVTPWGTVLTCEENYDIFVGDVRFSDAGKREFVADRVEFGWNEYISYPPEHYGWVVEVNPRTGRAQKHTGFGRMAHECATTIKTKSGKLVVYTGDDSDNEHLYKFISDSSDSLKAGTLYVANMEQGRWIPLKRDLDERLKSKFKDQLELLIRTREAAKVVGATPLDRPEDIEIHPETGDVFVALTNNKSRKAYFGSILRLREKDGDHSSLEFESSTFLAGGEANGFACPDNLAFDRRGNLWMTTDISGSFLNQTPYESFKNNSLFYIPLKGAHAGVAHRVASAPINAELTGPCFSPDGKTLFLSVQHPGERTKDLQKPLSRWPDGTGLPKPSVVAVDLPPSLV